MLRSCGGMLPSEERSFGKEEGMTMKTKILLGVGSLLTVGGIIAAIVFSLTMRRVDASAQVPALPAMQTLVGSMVVWKAPGTGWKPYDHKMISRLGVEVDECIQNEALKATVCVKVLDARVVGTPARSITRLFDKFDVDEEDRPRVLLQGTRASFTFSIDSGIVNDAMDIKVSSDVASGHSGKILMVMGAWESGSNKFSVQKFDAIAAQIRLR